MESSSLRGQHRNSGTHHWAYSCLAARAHQAINTAPEGASHPALLPTKYASKLTLLLRMSAQRTLLLKLGNVGFGFEINRPRLAIYPLNTDRPPNVCATGIISIVLIFTCAGRVETQYTVSAISVALSGKTFLYRLSTRV